MTRNVLPIWSFAVLLLLAVVTRIWMMSSEPGSLNFLDVSGEDLTILKVAKGFSGLFILAFGNALGASQAILLLLGSWWPREWPDGEPVTAGQRAALLLILAAPVAMLIWAAVFYGADHARRAEPLTWREGVLLL